MSVIDFLESKPAPFACRGGVNMSFIQLNILNWMAESELVDTSASCRVASHHDNWHLIDKFLSVRTMGFHR